MPAGKQTGRYLLQRLVKYPGVNGFVFIHGEKHKLHFAGDRHRGPPRIAAFGKDTLYDAGERKKRHRIIRHIAHIVVVCFTRQLGTEEIQPRLLPAP